MLKTTPKFASASDAELLAEMERRKKIRNTPPTPVANPDFSKLIATCVSSVTNSDKEDYWDDDIAHSIYEAAMAVYGKDYWKWHNQRF